MLIVNHGAQDVRHNQCCQQAFIFPRVSQLYCDSTVATQQNESVISATNYSGDRHTTLCRSVSHIMSPSTGKGKTECSQQDRVR